jgi:hypothetical protein
MLRKPLCAIVSPLLTAAVLAHVCTARAQQDNSAAVEALFDEGKRLMADGRVAQACPKFLASYNLEHRLGTLLNLAACYEKNGQLASAWARFVEARTLAARNNQPERQQFANEHATTLEPKLSKLTVSIAKPLPGLEVKVDGQPVAAGAWGVAVPMDAGKHAIEATAPDHVAYKGEVTLGGDADQKTVTVPELAEAPKAASLPEGQHVEENHGLGGRKIAALAIAGIGVASLGVGTYFGVAALGKNSDSNTATASGACTGNDCWGQNVGLRNDAVTDATLSTVLLGAGAAALIGGAVLWLTAPSSSTPAASVGFDGRTLRVVGSF